MPPTFAQRENAKKTVEHFFRDGASTATAADACLRVHASDARAPFKTVHSPPLGGRGLGVGLWGGLFFLAKPQRTQRKLSNISLGPSLTLPTRPLQADARAPFKTVHSPPLGGRGLGVGLWGGAFFLAKPQRTQRNKHGLAQTTKQSVLVCERPWQKIGSMDIFRGLDMLFHFV